MSVLGLDLGWTVKYNPCLQEFLRASPSGTHSGKGLYLTVYPLSRPNMDTVSQNIIFMSTLFQLHVFDFLFNGLIQVPKTPCNWPIPDTKIPRFFEQKFGVVPWLSIYFCLEGKSWHYEGLLPMNKLHLFCKEEYLLFLQSELTVFFIQFTTICVRS